MSLESFEREVAIGWDDSTKTAQVTALSKSIIKKLDKLCQEHPNAYKVLREIVVDGVIEGKEYNCPKRLINFRAPTAKRELTEEQRKAAAERMKKVVKRGKK